MRLPMDRGWGGQCRALSNRAKCANKWIVCYNVTYTCNRIYLPYHTHRETVETRNCSFPSPLCLPLSLPIWFYFIRVWIPSICLNVLVDWSLFRLVRALFSDSLQRKLQYKNLRCQFMKIYLLQQICRSIQKANTTISIVYYWEWKLNQPHFNAQSIGWPYICFVYTFIPLNREPIAVRAFIVCTLVLKTLNHYLFILTIRPMFIIYEVSTCFSFIAFPFIRIVHLVHRFLSFIFRWLFVAGRFVSILFWFFKWMNGKAEERQRTVDGGRFNGCW